jgi:hypothetical protein
VLYIGIHPFLNKNGTMNHKKQGNGEYEKVKKGRYSSALINLMERMMFVWLFDFNEYIIYYI